ncbi:MAG: HIT domain-containing protein [Syntrophales bacterium]|nr:HIT domain-containing protein [Syntrophales bacterium]
MESIIAPERIKYIKREKKEGCIFCSDSLREEALVLHEGSLCFVIMNKYPYTSGHLMVATHRHVAEMSAATKEELIECLELTVRSVEALKAAFDPQGFNIGMNVGAAAGAGYEGHMHVHIVPRWSGDTNFMTVLGEVRVIPEEIEKTKDILKTLF